jgi:hypothetical protein
MKFAMPPIAHDASHQPEMVEVDREYTLLRDHFYSGLPAGTKRRETAINMQIPSSAPNATFRQSGATRAAVLVSRPASAARLLRLPAIHARRINASTAQQKSVTSNSHSWLNLKLPATSHRSGQLDEADRRQHTISGRAFSACTELIDR